MDRKLFEIIVKELLDPDDVFERASIMSSEEVTRAWMRACNYDQELDRFERLVTVMKGPEATRRFSTNRGRGTGDYVRREVQEAWEEWKKA